MADLRSLYPYDNADRTSKVTVLGADIATL